MSTTDPVEKAKAGLLAKEPTLISWAAGGAAGIVGSYLLLHYGVDANVTKQVVTPVVVGVGATVFGFLNRRVVVPVATYAETVEKDVQSKLSTGGGIQRNPNPAPGVRGDS
jgi:hypothetical protein